MGSWWKVEGRRHETEEKDKEGDECAPAARGVEGNGIVDGGYAQETHAEKEKSPNVPALPEAEETEREENDRKKDGDEAVKRSAERAENVAAVELGNWQEIEGSSEETDPSGAADGMEQKSAGRDAGMHDGGEETQ